jgi:hypothetical protein
LGDEESYNARLEKRAIYGAFDPLVRLERRFPPICGGNRYLSQTPDLQGF